jgi:hypothetical protein
LKWERGVRTYLWCRNHISQLTQLSGFRTKREAATLALEEFVAKRHQRQVLKLQGTFDIDPEFDYKEQRHRA